MKEKKTDKDREKIEKPVGTLKKKTVIPRGRIFEGMVIAKFPKRVSIGFERMVYVQKYERYAKSKTKLHARLPEEMEKQINVGDLIKIQECRPLSKILHFIVIKKIKSGESGK